MKIVFSDPKLGKSAQMELTLDKAAPLLNKKIGETIDATFMGLTGYKLKITGGSDKSGFPMNPSIEGTGKVKVFTPAEMSGRSKGIRTRASMRGNMISADTEQVNAIIVEYGDKPAAELFPVKEKKEGEKKEAKKEEKKAEKK